MNGHGYAKVSPNLNEKYGTGKNGKWDIFKLRRQMCCRLEDPFRRKEFLYKPFEGNNLVLFTEGRL
ncbi:MAG: hypothetical protein HY754_02040 [Nitrospirae bacterium]|nr:hypothetical protein [Nitrospirota bacterium]